MSKTLLIIAATGVLAASQAEAKVKPCTDFKSEGACPTERDTQPCEWNGPLKGCCKNWDADKEICVNNKWWNDGGCRPKTYCGFHCRRLCKAQKDNGCRWNIDDKKCVYVGTQDGEYEYDEYISPIISDFEDVLMYESDVGVASGVGLTGFDDVCKQSRPAEGSKQECALGYNSVAMVCSKTRDVQAIAQKLGVGVNAEVRGPGKNAALIGTLANIFADGKTFVNTPHEAGINTHTFWSGCTKDGQEDEKRSLDCTEWKNGVSTKSGVMGDTRKTNTGAFKFWSSAPCNSEQKLLCLCARRV